MTNDKKKNREENQKINRGNFLKSLFIRLSLIVLLVLSIFIFIKQYKEKPRDCLKPHLPSTSLYPKKAPEEEIKLIQLPIPNKIESPNCQPILSESQVKFMTVGMIQGVLEGRIKLTALKEFLQSRPEAWAQKILTTLKSTQHIKTYLQLETMLVEPPVQVLPIWQRVKRKVKALIRIRKIDKEGNFVVPEIKDLKKALQNHDLKASLVLYNRLPPMEKSLLKDWETAVSLRFALETIITNLLTELTESNIL